MKRTIKSLNYDIYLKGQRAEKEGAIEPQLEHIIYQPELTSKPNDEKVQHR